jgi:hypothetical protein
MPENLNYEAHVEQLVNAQLKDWAFAAKNYSDLNKIQLKNLQFNGFHLIVQFNTARIISSSAKIDIDSIQKRPCFLCAQNRPINQKSIDFKETFWILVNPYPIFSQHLTIINKKHFPQLIKPYFADMMELARELPTFTIFYNGPKCGASAPDHFHFQAGTKGYMPLDYQIDKIIRQFGTIQKSGICNVWKIDDGIRKFFHIESDDKQAVQDVFIEIYEILDSLNISDDEPGLNVLCTFTNNLWKVNVFPRGKHRPWQYSAPDDEKIIFSPASVDLGGLLVIPLEKDFMKINEKLAVDMLQQIGLDEEIFNQINLKN